MWCHVRHVCLGVRSMSFPLERLTRLCLKRKHNLFFVAILSENMFELVSRPDKRTRCINSYHNSCCTLSSFSQALKISCPCVCFSANSLDPHSFDRTVPNACSRYFVVLSTITVYRTRIGNTGRTAERTTPNRTRQQSQELVSIKL